jgi:hypothetical protein
MSNLCFIYTYTHTEGNYIQCLSSPAFGGVPHMKSDVELSTDVFYLGHQKVSELGAFHFSCIWTQNLHKQR